MDKIVGGSTSTVINAVADVAANKDATLTSLDNINGGTSGNNTLNINELTGGSASFTGVTMSNVQTVNLNSVGAINLNLKTAAGVTGVTTLNTTSLASGDAITVGSGTAVNATNSVGAVTVHGTNSAVTVSAAGLVTIDTGASTETVTTAGGVVLSGATGAVTATDSAQGAANSTIIDGSSVSLTTAVKLDGVVANVVGHVATTSMVTIGSVGHLPTGAVTVSESLAGDKANNGYAGDITVNGGSTVTINQTAVQPLNTAPAAGATNINYPTTLAPVAVNGSAVTTAVTVNQTPHVVSVNTTTAQAGATTSDSLVFSGMASGNSITVGGLTFTAAGVVTAAQAAAAFANLSAGATQGASTLGTYSGTALTGFSTGAASTATVVATSSTANAVKADIATSTVGGTAPVVTPVTVGAAATAAVAGVGGINDNTVTIVDVNGASTTTAGSITSVNVSGYGGVANITDNALATLSLANSVGATVTVTDHLTVPTATTLGLTVNGLGAGSVFSDATIKALNITTATADSVLNVTAAAVTALTVAGTNAIDLTSSTLTGLKTVTVSGAAGVTVDVHSDGSLTDFNASATSGNNTVTIDATKATYEGGSGNDVVTLFAANPTKAINLGAGNNTLVLASGTNAAPSVTLDGGTGGTNTLSMTAADAVTDSGSALFSTKVVDFQHLTLTAATTNVVDAALLGHYNYVTDAGSTSLTINNMTSGATLVQSAAAADTVNLTAASALTLNDIVTANGVGLTTSVATGSDAAGTITAGGVQTVNISALDTSTTDAAGTITHHVTLTDSAATTITVTGNANLALTVTGDTAISTINASAMTGGLTVTAAGVVAETITGGAGTNVLTACGGVTGTIGDTLIGGSGGHDTLTANAGLDTLTGGAGGHETFVIVPSTNSSSYATITNAVVGDTIQFGVAGTAVSFTAGAVVLAGTAVFQDYVNASVHASVIGGISWFQYGGNTYVVENNAATHESAFVNGTDSIVKLTGAVDLSHTSLNTAHATLLIG